MIRRQRPPLLDPATGFGRVVLRRYARLVVPWLVGGREPLWAFVAAGLLNACSQQLTALQDLGAPGGAPGAGGAVGTSGAGGGNQDCLDAGDPCDMTSFNQCCGGARCSYGGICEAAGDTSSSCIAQGQPCSTQSTCCYGTSCQRGGARSSICAPCLVHGSPCSSSNAGDCCSKHCGSNATGQQVCLALDGCQPAGETCLGPNDCCSSDCLGSVPKCSAGSPDCRQEGDLCTSSKQCDCLQSNLDCSSAWFGLSRCESPSANQPYDTGHSCTQSSQCSSDQCRQDSAGGPFTCHSKCADIGSYCRAPSDCCSGQVCSPAGVCANSLQNTCPPPGSFCPFAACCIDAGK
jgi:hypothetical protein